MSIPVYNKDARNRINRSVKDYEEKNLKGQGMGLHNRFIQTGEENRLVRITKEVCNGYYNGIESGFRDQKDVDPTYYTWHDEENMGVFEDNYKLMEISQRENIPVGTMVIAYPGGISTPAEDDGSDSRDKTLVKYVFKWEGNEGGFTAHPFYDSDGFRHFLIRSGIVQVGDQESLVGMTILDVENPLDDCDGSNAPSPSSQTDFYWVEITFTYDCECPFWEVAVNPALQTAPIRPDLFEYFKEGPSGEPDEPVDTGGSASPDCDQLTKIVWRVLIGEVTDDDWIQHHTGSIQHHSFVPWDLIEGFDVSQSLKLVSDKGCVKWEFDPDGGGGGCKGITETRTLPPYSGVVFIEEVTPDFFLLKQKMYTVKDVYKAGRLCSYTVNVENRTIGEWCCPVPSPSPSPSLGPSPVSSPSPSPTTPSPSPAGSYQYESVTCGGSFIHTTFVDKSDVVDTGKVLQMLINGTDLACFSFVSDDANPPDINYVIQNIFDDCDSCNPSPSPSPVPSPSPSPGFQSPSPSPANACAGVDCSGDPSMQLRVSNQGATETITWCGKTWNLPADNGLIQCVCPTTYSLLNDHTAPTPSQSYYGRERWAHSGLDLVRGVRKQSVNSADYYVLDKYWDLNVIDGTIFDKEDRRNFKLEKFSTASQTSTTNIAIEELYIIDPNTAGNDASAGDYRLKDIFFNQHTEGNVTYEWFKGEGFAV